MLACDDRISGIETKSLEGILNSWRFPLGASHQHRDLAVPDSEAFRGSAVRLLLRHLSQYRRDNFLFDDGGDDDFP